VSNGTPPATDVRLVVGYDGSAPATRALDAAVNLLQGRAGGIDVVYVAHMPSMAALSAGAVTELETGFDDIERELRTRVREQLRGREERWEFERRQGIIAEELLATAKDTSDAHTDATVVIVVGSSSQVTHRVVGSVAVGLARHSPVPLIVVPYSRPCGRRHVSAQANIVLSSSGVPSAPMNVRWTSLCTRTVARPPSASQAMKLTCAKYGSNRSRLASGPGRELRRVARTRSRRRTATSTPRYRQRGELGAGHLESLQDVAVLCPWLVPYPEQP
jgi:nucleotide-binding universal stress UspA family protein